MWTWAIALAWEERKLMWDSIAAFWQRIERYVMVAILLWYSDHADVFHTEPVAGLLGGDESTGDVSIIDAVAKGIACFFGVC